MSRSMPSRDELIALMAAKIAEARASLRAASETLAMSAAQREEYQKLLSALDDLERRIQNLKV